MFLIPDFNSCRFHFWVYRYSIIKRWKINKMEPLFVRLTYGYGLMVAHMEI